MNQATDVTVQNFRCQGDVAAFFNGKGGQNVERQRFPPEAGVELKRPQQFEE